MFKRFINWLAKFSPDYREQRWAAQRNRELVVIYAAALRDIVITTEAVKVPNGTTKKVARLANGAFNKAMAS